MQTAKQMIGGLRRKLDLKIQQLNDPRLGNEDSWHEGATIVISANKIYGNCLSTINRKFGEEGVMEMLTDPELEDLRRELEAKELLYREGPRTNPHIYAIFLNASKLNSNQRNGS